MCASCIISLTEFILETIGTRVKWMAARERTTDETAQHILCMAKTAIVHLHYHNVKPCIRALHTHRHGQEHHEPSNAQRNINNGYLFTLWMHRSHDLWPSAWSNTYSAWIQPLWNMKKKTITKRCMRLRINKTFFSVFIPVPVVGAVPGRAPQLTVAITPCKLYV